MRRDEGLYCEEFCIEELSLTGSTNENHFQQFNSILNVDSKFRTLDGLLVMSQLDE